MIQRYIISLHARPSHHYLSSNGFLVYSSSSSLSSSLYGLAVGGVLGICETTDFPAQGREGFGSLSSSVGVLTIGVERMLVEVEEGGEGEVERRSTRFLGRIPSLAERDNGVSAQCLASRGGVGSKGRQKTAVIDIPGSIFPIAFSGLPTPAPGLAPAGLRHRPPTSILLVREDADNVRAGGRGSSVESQPFSTIYKVRKMGRTEGVRRLPPPRALAQRYSLGCHRLR